VFLDLPEIQKPKGNHTLKEARVVKSKDSYEGNTNKRDQRALGRSPEDKVKGQSGANNRKPQGHNLNNFGKGPYYILNMKALGLVVLDKKIFESFISKIYLLTP